MSDTTDTKNAMTRYQLDDAVRRARKKNLLIGFGVGLAVMLLATVFGSWYGQQVRTTDDFRYGQSFEGEADCETLAEAVYGHDLFVLRSTQTFDGWAPKAAQAFFRGCDGQPQGDDGWGGDGGGGD